MMKKWQCDYSFAEKAVHIQEIVESIYAGN